MKTMKTKIGMRQIGEMKMKIKPKIGMRGGEEKNDNEEYNRQMRNKKYFYIKRRKL